MINLRFDSPLTSEQRQKLAELVAEQFNQIYADSFEAYSLVVDTDTEEQYLYGCEHFIFKDLPT